MFLDFSLLDIAGKGVAGRGVAGRDVASSSTGGFRLTRQSSAAARPSTVAPCELWLAGYFKGYFVGGSMREVCAGGEDILLRGGRARGTAVRLARREASAS